MSKSLGNVVNPDDIVNDYGADTLRTYEMFIGDFEKPAPWSDDSVRGCRRFIDRVCALAEKCNDSYEYTPELDVAINKAIKKVTDDIEQMKFNTAIAAMMTLVNEFTSAKVLSRGDVGALLKILSPFAPHVAEEIWSELGFEGLVCQAQWPAYDESKLVEDVIELPVQINGKMRGKVSAPAKATQDEAVAIALEALKDKIDANTKVVKIIYVPGKILNLIMK